MSVCMAHKGTTPHMCIYDCMYACMRVCIHMYAYAKLRSSLGKEVRDIILTIVTCCLHQRLMKMGTWYA